MKKLVIIATLFIAFSSVNNANAQGFWEAVNRAATAISNANNTYNEVKNTFTSSTSSNQSYVQTVYMVGWSGSNNNIKTTPSGDLYLVDGVEKVKYNGSWYPVRENPSYSAYSSDSNSPSYYKYYISASKTLYFNK